MIDRPMKIAPNMPPLHAWLSKDGIAEDDGEPDHANYAKKVTHEARPCGRVEFCAEVGIQGLLDEDADTGSYCKEDGPDEILHNGYPDN
jgi:hypothetical protein